MTKSVTVRKRRASLCAYLLNDARITSWQAKIGVGKGRLAAESYLRNFGLFLREHKMSVDQLVKMNPRKLAELVEARVRRHSHELGAGTIPEITASQQGLA